MRRLCFVLCFVSFLFSCNDDSGSQPELETSNFYALSVGNTWTYNYFNVSITGDLTNTEVEEEVKVTEEVMLDGKTYYNLQKTTSNNSIDGSCGVCEENGVSNRLVRDSLGYLVTSEGQILFSNQNFNEYLISENDWGDIYASLLVQPSVVLVEAGSFNSLNNKRFAYQPSGELYEGKDDIFYSSNIGEIKMTFSAVVAGRVFYEKHLMSYSID